MMSALGRAEGADENDGTKPICIVKPMLGASCALVWSLARRCYGWVGAQMVHLADSDGDDFLNVRELGRFRFRWEMEKACSL